MSRVRLILLLFQKIFLIWKFIQIELKADDLYDKEKVDLETIVIDDVFALLQCNDQGLSTQEAQRRLEIFGPNKLEQEEQNAFLQVGSQFLTHLLVLLVD
jgi:magnesium-transporting ATPase (P-type)